MNMAELPLVSVIVPVYNVEKYLNECVNSIRSQTYPHLQIILIEDCSTDDSLKTIEPHLADPRVCLLRHEHNSGLSSARNTGIDASTGEYLMFVDSDDFIDARLVETCINCILQTNADVVIYGFSPFKDVPSLHDQSPMEQDALRWTQTLGEKYFSLPHFAWLKFIRSDLLRSNAVRFPVGLCYEDWPFHWSLGLVAKKTCQLDCGFYHYRQRETSITGSTGSKLLDLFSVQFLVMECVKNLTHSSLGNLLADKIWDSHWSVLTRIDSKFLCTALEKSKESDRSMSVRGLVAHKTWRRSLIIAIIRCPLSFSIISMQLLRSVLTLISPERRRAASFRGKL